MRECFDACVCGMRGWKKKLMMASDQHQLTKAAKKLSFQIYAASICQLVQTKKGMNDFFRVIVWYTFIDTNNVATSGLAIEMNCFSAAISRVLYIPLV